MTFQALGYAAWFFGLWLLLKLRYDLPFWSAMGWRVRWPRPLLTLALGPILVLVVMALGAALRTPEIDNAIQQLLRDRISVLLVGAFATTVGPLAEELIFRGFLQPVAMRTLGPWAGIVVASLPFALLHGPQYRWSWQHIALLLVASVTFGMVRWRANSTAASTLVHATYNLTFYLGFLMQRKELLF
jgi:membrane protease YdiL (CAAX protease family)